MYESIYVYPCTPCHIVSILEKSKQDKHSLKLTSSITIDILRQNTIPHSMKRITQFSSIESPSFWQFICTYRPVSKPLSYRCLHTTPPQPATVEPITASGPPPSAPVASAEHANSRVARRRKQAELLKRGQDLRAVAGGSGGGTAKQKRFWRDVHVRKVDGKQPFP